MIVSKLHILTHILTTEQRVIMSLYRLLLQNKLIDAMTDAVPAVEYNQETRQYQQQVSDQIHDDY